MKRIAGYLFVVSALFALTFCKDKDDDDTPIILEGAQTPSTELLAGKTLKTYKLSVIKADGLDITSSPLFQPCQKSFLYDFYADNRFFQRKGDPACPGKDTSYISTWKFNKTKDSLIIGGSLGKGRIKSMNSSAFTISKDTLGFKNLEITLQVQ